MTKHIPESSPKESNRQNVLGIVVLIATYLFSIGYVVSITRNDRRTDDNADLKTLRLVHNMAEDTTQQAFRDLADNYQALHPDVRIIIQTIPQGAYQQWVTTQCIGGTAPDLIQAQNKWDQMWASIATRYMVPLTQYAGTANPYNQGTNLEGVSWRETFLDNMRSGYWDHLTEYYTIPLTVETMRIFYNKDIFQQATGSDQPPGDFDEWMTICGKIKEYADTHEVQLFPIASSSRGIKDFIWYPYYFALTDGISDPYEPSYWAFGNPIYTLFSLYTNSFTFKQPRIEAPFIMARRVAHNCQPGYEAASIAETRFLFTQGKAAMVLGNVRDAHVFQETMDFRLGVFDYPLPAPESEFGKYVVARKSETETPVTHFFLSQTSHSPDIALDFMMFCTSVQQNEAFNAQMNWYPIIRGAKPLDYLTVFTPHIEGASLRTMPVTHPNFKQIHLWAQQTFPLYFSGEISFEQFMTELESMWLTKGPEDLAHISRNYEKSLKQSERNIAMAHARLLYDEAGQESAQGVFGTRSIYHIALESNQLLEHGIAMTEYIWDHLQEGDYPYP